MYTLFDGLILEARAIHRIRGGFFFSFSFLLYSVQNLPGGEEAVAIFSKLFTLFSSTSYHLLIDMASMYLFCYIISRPNSAL